MPLLCQSHDIRMHSYVICMSLVCTRMSSIYYSYDSHISRMSLEFTRMSPECHSYVFVCHPYVTCPWFYHEPSRFQFFYGLVIFFRNILKKMFPDLARFWNTLVNQKCNSFSHIMGPYFQVSSIYF